MSAMNPILKRILTALVTAAVVAGLLIWLPRSVNPERVIVPLLILVAGAVHLEFSQMVARKHPILVGPGVAVGMIYLFSVSYAYSGLLPVLFFVLAMLTLFGPTQKPIATLATTVLGFVYVPWMLRELVWFAQASTGSAWWLLLYVVALVKVSDMGGFAFGVAFGRHKMCPTVSPKKSWEGMAGSVFASCVVSLAFKPLTGYSLPASLCFGVVAAVTGTLGDLVESRFKRACEVKDSGTFMPAGMGGLLDMFDSLVFAPAALHLAMGFVG